MTTTQCSLNNVLKNSQLVWLWTKWLTSESLSLMAKIFGLKLPRYTCFGTMLFLKAYVIALQLQITLFFVRTSKFWLILGVLKFSQVFSLLFSSLVLKFYCRMEWHKYIFCLDESCILALFKILEIVFTKMNNTKYRKGKKRSTDYSKLHCIKLLFLIDFSSRTGIVSVLNLFFNFEQK